MTSSPSYLALSCQIYHKHSQKGGISGGGGTPEKHGSGKKMTNPVADIARYCKRRVLWASGAVPRIKELHDAEVQAKRQQCSDALRRARHTGRERGSAKRLSRRQGASRHNMQGTRIRKGRVEGEPWVLGQVRPANWYHRPRPATQRTSRADRASEHQVQ